MIRRTLTILRALAALMAMFGLTFGVPVLLVALIGNPVPINWTWNQPLTNDAILGVVACVAWIFWAQMIVCLIIETVVEVRIATGRSGEWLSRVPGTFGGQQALARTLVQAVLAVGLTSTAVTTTGPWVAHAEAAIAATPAQPQASSTVASHLTAVQATSKPRRAATSTVDVRRGDSLWAIAERHFGSGERWREIADLNRNRLMPDGNRFRDASTILPGWTLLIPANAANGVVTVEQGDTLWEIAEKQYGDGTKWPAILEANGARIEDPNLIYPGQRLRIPGHQVSDNRQKVNPKHPDTHNVPKRNEEPSGSVGTPPASPTSEPSPASTNPQEPAAQDTPTMSHEDNATDTTIGDSSLARALLGGGAFLAAGLVVALAARRRNQFRNRRSGRTVPRTPEPLAEIERTVRATGSAGGEAAAFLDAALRELASKARDEGASLPDVEAARIDDERLDLHLGPAGQQPPSPWLASADQSVWSLSREHMPVPGADATPYPTLVSLGIDDEGGVWLIDLESAGLVQVTGDPNVATEVARFIAAELAVNPRAIDVDVTLAGLGDELVALNPDRCRVAEAQEISLLTKAALRAREASEVSGLDVLAGRLDGRGADSWWPTVHIASIGTDHEVDARRDMSSFFDELSRVRGRSSVGLVTAVRDVLAECGLVLRIQPGGRLATPWGDIKVNRLHADEASALAQLVEHHDHAADEPMPAATPDESEALYDAAGAIIDTRTEARDGIGGESSLLPLADEAYVETAATTVEDLTALAPRVPPEVARKAREEDVQLDADLAEWTDPNSPRPKVKVLGPVEVRVPRDRPIDVGRRPAYYFELVAYLSAHPEGSTTDRIAAAFAVQNPTIHSRMATLRGWLGRDPRTGEPFVPESTLSPAGLVRGVPIYQLCGGLSDEDLFKRLRARGQARGSDGMSDLVEALRLVTGRPYDQLRPSGYGWLAETPVDHYAVAAIVDVAHVVATHSLATDEPERALWAAQRAITAAPSDDKPRLDLARAMQALGHVEDARGYLATEIFNRSDDDHAPPDPSPRVSQVASRLKGSTGQAEIRDSGARG